MRTNHEVAKAQRRKRKVTTGDTGIAEEDEGGREEAQESQKDYLVVSRLAFPGQEKSILCFL